jgi:hypothetical protein
MRVIITIKGGMVSGFYTDQPDELRGQVSIIDEDCEPENADDEETERELRVELNELEDIFSEG